MSTKAQPDTDSEFAVWQGHQTRQLAQWKTKLLPEVYGPIADYVVATNNIDLRRCYRGQDLVEIIIEWPEVSACYATDPRKAAEVI